MMKTRRTRRMRRQGPWMVHNASIRCAPAQRSRPASKLHRQAMQQAAHHGAAAVLCLLWLQFGLDDFHGSESSDEPGAPPCGGSSCRSRLATLPARQCAAPRSAAAAASPHRCIYLPGRGCAVAGGEEDAVQRVAAETGGRHVHADWAAYELPTMCAPDFSCAGTRCAAAGGGLGTCVSVDSLPGHLIFQASP